MLSALLTLALSSASGDSVPVRVDARVELLTLVFRLAGNPEFNMPVSSSRYADEAAQWFEPAKEHRVFALARALRREHGISFNAVPDLAVHLTPPPELALRVPLVPRPERLDSRWEGADVEGFLVALRDFAEETSFLEFLASFDRVQRAAEQRLAARVEEAGVLDWLKEFFGLATGTGYVAVPGLLCGGGNYGASVRLEDGTLELWPILGVSSWDAEGLPLYDAESVSLVAHEFTHAFANPVIDAHWKALQPSFERIFPGVKAVMEAQAYADPKTVAYESLVRACVVRHAARKLGADAAERQCAEEVSRGFAWTPDLARLLEQYEADRKTYASLQDFGPRLAEFFAAVAKQGAPEKAPKSG